MRGLCAIVLVGALLSGALSPGIAHVGPLSAVPSSFVSRAVHDALPDEHATTAPLLRLLGITSAATPHAPLHAALAAMELREPAAKTYGREAELARAQTLVTATIAQLEAEDAAELALNFAEAEDPRPTIAKAPSAAAVALVAAYGGDASAEQFAALDALPPMTRQAIASVLAAELRFTIATRAVVGDILPAARAEPGRYLAPAGDHSPRLTLDWRNAIAARGELLRGADDLRHAMAAETIPPLSLSVSPALSIDLGTADNEYVEPFALLLDAGGNDTYRNNAGGSNLELTCNVPRSAVAGALVDLAGDDEYVSQLSCGINGGGSLGAGLLVDYAGDDEYRALDVGVNGGGHIGLGLLLDVAGSDFYRAQHSGVNGGGTIGGQGGIVDLDGADQYRAGSIASNGGGSVGGMGSILDANGNDLYSAGTDAVNGGGNLGGIGRIVDLGGDDSYTLSGSTGNGGSFAAIGFLYDVAGNDVYAAAFGGGANGGSDGGVGLLVDGSGDDDYLVGRESCRPVLCSFGGGTGVNGGAAREALGFLLDLAGDDEYNTGQAANDRGTGANGAGVNAAGFLFDAKGNDTYISSRRGVNGGAILGLGLLLDLGGIDQYLDFEGGTGSDKTVVPKETNGAQVDVQG